MPEPLIEIDDLWLSYDEGRTFALKGVSLAVETGAFVALVGRSGSGKTSLLKSLNGLAAPTRGAITVDGEATDAMPPHVLRRKIGYAFQGVGLFPHMSVGENIGITPRLLGWTRPEIDARIGKLLDLVELPRATATRPSRALSGGQQQRVGLARALAARPKIMLLDEPFGALDPLTRESLGLAYRGLHERLGLTTLMVTHDLEEALLLCDRVVVVEAGEIRADATPRGLVDSGDAMIGALLDVPRRHAARMRDLFGP